VAPRAGGADGDRAAEVTGCRAWLTGGTFGPEASVLAPLLVSSVTVGALLLALKTGRLAVRRSAHDGGVDGRPGRDGLYPRRPTQSSAQAPDNAGTCSTHVRAVLPAWSRLAVSQQSAACGRVHRWRIGARPLDKLI
jgi:hypothetical protein